MQATIEAAIIRALPDAFNLHQQNILTIDPAGRLG